MEVLGFKEVVCLWCGEEVDKCPCVWDTHPPKWAYPLVALGYVITMPIGIYNKAKDLFRFFVRREK